MHFFEYILDLIINYWPILILCFLSAGFREAMEHSKESKFKSKFWGERLSNFLNTGKSWRNKYKKDGDGNLILIKKSPWYYFGLVTPEYKERFPFSSTMLVFLTDAEHLFQFLATCSACFAIGLAAHSVDASIVAFFGFLILGFVKEVFFPQVS